MTAFINRFLVCGALLVGGIVVVGADVASAVAPVAPTASAIVVSANGTQVAMTFTQDLHPNIAPKEQFAVTIGTYAAPTTRTLHRMVDIGLHKNRNRGALMQASVQLSPLLQQMHRCRTSRCCG